MSYTKPIINAHAHIFKSEDTPSYLAKKIVVWPFYYIFNIHRIVGAYKKYLKRQDKKYTHRYKNKAWEKYVNGNYPINRFLRRVLLFFVNIIFFFYAIYVLLPYLSFWPFNDVLKNFYDKSDPIIKQLLFLDNRFSYLGILFVLFLLFRDIRNKTLKFIWKQIEKRLGKEMIALKLRYVNIVEYAKYKRMSDIYGRLRSQYPPESKFIVLPMDMEFMDAGKTKRPYPEQMTELLKIKSNHKDTMYPFLFAHPKRMNKMTDITINGTTTTLPYFKGDLDDTGKFALEDCAVKTYLENGCAGIKIYPAMGYYVFAKELLPLWLYCAQNEIPVLTHCAVGPIFYRGDLRKLDPQIDEHPVFMQNIGSGETRLRLKLYKNSLFQKNFTHPLNYCCLLEEDLLKRVLDYHNDTELNALFGYDVEHKDQPLERNLSQLKINLAHYGGAEHWDQFLEQDRYSRANSIINNPSLGLPIREGLKNINVVEDYWHEVDWFTLISSMIINYENVYADVSYTSYDLKYLNLLSEILDNSSIKDRVLFGTDFYVVSNHKSEKQYWIDMEGSLSPDKWDMLSDNNPKSYLNSTYTTL